MEQIISGLKDVKGKDIKSGDRVSFESSLCYGVHTGIVKMGAFEYGEGADRFKFYGWFIAEDGSLTDLPWDESIGEASNIEIL